MLKISKQPTNRSGKPASTAHIQNAKVFVKLESAFPILGEAIVERSTPKYRSALVQLIRSASSDAAAHGLAKLLDAGNSSQFFQTYEGIFVGVSQPEATSAITSDHAAMLAALGLGEPEAEAGSDEVDTDPAE